jgi:hypothetical protein
MVAVCTAREPDDKTRRSSTRWRSTLACAGRMGDCLLAQAGFPALTERDRELERLLRDQQEQ